MASCTKFAEAISHPELVPHGTLSAYVHWGCGKSSGGFQGECPLTPTCGERHSRYMKELAKPRYKGTLHGKLKIQVRTATRRGAYNEPYDFEEILDEENYLCYWCGKYRPRKEWVRSVNGNMLTPEHLISIKRWGGPDVAWNVLPACRFPCQSQKGSSLLADLMERGRSPKRFPTDERVWVRLAPGQLWVPGMVGKVPWHLMEEA